MIILVAVLAILLLISIVVNFHLFKKAKVNQETAQYFKKRWEYEKGDSQVHQRKVNDLEREIAELKPKTENEYLDEVETGATVKRRFYRPVTAETYRNLFDIDPNGGRILEHMVTIFCKSTYVRGGHEADRESCFRAGQNSVIQHILKQINKANDPNYKGEVDES